MSESILKAILRLFALVARSGETTSSESVQIRTFLEEHLRQSAVDGYMKYFSEYSASLKESSEELLQKLKKETEQINAELTQKQKCIILLDLLVIMLADNVISPEEETMLRVISTGFKIDDNEVAALRNFVTARAAADIGHEQILIVGKKDQEHSPAKFIQRDHLSGFAAVLHSAQNDMYFVKYVGHTDVLLNGVPLVPGKISVFAVGSFLRWDKDEPLYFGNVQAVFKKFGELTRTSFEATNITFRFKNGKLGLRNVSLAEESGNLVALMGASGAGKSTLLHVLNGTEKPHEGQVLINGIDIHKTPEKIEGVIGFVPQDDLLIEDLTVYQNLYYAAKLCFSNKSETEIDALVLRVLEDLGLAEIRDLKVGSPLRKTISGGQRKRLNIGLELLREPAVLFCDEPTSGLSSRDSENIIDLLKELSLKGKLVFAVIHQPSSDIFKMFDKLLILDTGGFQIYYGNPVDAIVYFKRCINMVNSDEGECHECGNVNPEQIFNIIETKVINEYGHFTNERKMSPEQWNQFFKKSEKEFKVETCHDVPHSTLDIPSRIKQTHLFSLRDLQSKLHNTQYLVINLLEAPLLAFILAYIVRWYNVDDKLNFGYTLGKNLNLPAYLFMSVIVALFMGLTVSAEEIIRDRKILKREAFLHLSRSSYLLSKISILFMISAIQTFLFVLVGNSILQIEGLFLHHWFILFTASCFANLLGLNISSAFNSAVTIYILIPLLLIPQLILSGVVVKFDKLNPSIGNSSTVPFVGDLMASRWAFEAAMVTQFKDNKFEREFYKYEKVMANTDFKKIYLIPELETKLQFCINNFHTNVDSVKTRMEKELVVLRNEINKELEVVGKDKFTYMDKLNVASFDSATFIGTTTFLDHLKRFYMRRYNAADQEKEKLISSYTNTPEKERAFEQYREANHNDAIADLVKNLAETNRIIEKDGELIQKIFPIYKEPDPDHMVDFDAQFYMPAKHFLNTNVDTFWFNTGVIWSMTLVLAIALYFDLLRRILEGFGNLANTRQRK